MLTSFVIMALACYRLSDLLSDVNQGGPWDILNRLRLLIGVRFDQNSNPYGTNMVSNGILCVYCNSVWIGTAMAVMYAILPEFTTYISIPLALSGVAIFLSLR